MSYCGTIVQVWGSFSERGPPFLVSEVLVQTLLFANLLIWRDTGRSLDSPTVGGPRRHGSQ